MLKYLLQTHIGRSITFGFSGISMAFSLGGCYSYKNEQPLPENSDFIMFVES
jgi:hypothetical protein